MLAKMIQRFMQWWRGYNNPFCFWEMWLMRTRDHKSGALAEESKKLPEDVGETALKSATKYNDPVAFKLIVY